MLTGSKCYHQQIRELIVSKMLTILRYPVISFYALNVSIKKAIIEIFKTGLTRLELIKLVVGQRIWKYSPPLYY